MRSSGLAIGLVVGLVIAGILMKAANKDGKLKSKYDERQEAIRGKGYKYSFYTLIAFELVVMILKAGNFSAGIFDMYLPLIGVLTGCFVLCVYSIWNGAYWGLNNNKKSYMIIMIVASIINLLPVIGWVRYLNAGGEINVSEDLFPMTNVLVLVWLALIGIVALVKKAISPKENVEG